MIRPIALPLGCLAAAILLVGCGGADKGKTPAKDETSPTKSPSPSKAVSEAAELEAAEATLKNFLKALAAKDGAAAYALLGKGFMGRMGEGAKKAKTLTLLLHPGNDVKDLTDYELKEKKLWAGGRLVEAKGVFKKSSRPFQIDLGKDPESDQWRIDSFTSPVISTWE
ncbi:MAG: hypothetical protein U0793_13480 [Gemmataceae bacterium]